MRTLCTLRYSLIFLHQTDELPRKSDRRRLHQRPQTSIPSTYSNRTTQDTKSHPEEKKDCNSQSLGYARLKAGNYFTYIDSPKVSGLTRTHKVPLPIFLPGARPILQTAIRYELTHGTERRG
ncbi:Hypothetical predicted protein [Pelobates cultripes]|uniref:Uncharacterized protein n=1 Tax=Pelobates cultripes TaxID=61616 RepID=A0AAD1WBV6_PELCU|nr:Hypothetical predicted protein [Pelobates cultripes]